jgi:adenine-specific DNA-methyltransferase
MIISVSKSLEVITMANLTKIKRDEMVNFIHQLKKKNNDDESIRALNEIENSLTEKKFGLVFEEHSEEADEKLKEYIPVLSADKDRVICKDPNLPYNFIIEGDNLHALYLLEKTHRNKIDCIYIDPPYNSGAHDWKYNNDYVDDTDAYKHSKWLSMMKDRLQIAKKLLNPDNSVLICTIDEKEYLHLGCLLEEMFQNARIQMISDAINPKGVARSGFSRNDEYIFFVMIGKAIPNRLPLGDEWSSSATISASPSAKNKKGNRNPGWTSMMRRGSNSSRPHSYGCYYPIYVDPKDKIIKFIGDPVDKDKKSGPTIGGLIQVLPIRSNGSEGVWQVSPSELKTRLSQGRIRVGRETNYGFVINYLPDGAYKELLGENWEITGKAGDGSLLAQIRETAPLEDLRVAPTQWKIATHNASENGSSLIEKILCDKRFSYPKSLYSEFDAIRFFVSNNKKAIILDFFAGSGTTLHAINLLNRVDGGHRTCILVTNNEISEREEKELTKQGYKKGDPKWENLGIAKYVTWPRTFCSINGIDINGQKLSGNYFVKDNHGNSIEMSEGFSSNVKYFTCDWIKRKPEDFLLSNALCLHIKEMIELQNGIEIDNIKYLLILTRNDFENYFMNCKNRKNICKIWINQNIIFNIRD